MEYMNRQELPRNPSIKDAADFLGVDPKTIRRYISKALIKAHRIGPRWIRIERQSLLNLATPVGVR
jgi:excisionase family DNA binding protein